MRTAVIAIVVVAIEANLGFAQKMTYEEAKRAIPQQPLPAFWITDLPALSARWAALKHGQSEVIAHSPGGRPLHLITFGTREELPSDANFNSAIGGRQPSAYLDKEKRAKPVIFFVGPVHGQETEGLVGLVNLIHILETGRDLRDRERATLRSLAERCRLLILPSGNPDGLARFEPRTSRGMTIAESEFWGMGTWADGTIAMWPASKRLHPFVVSALYHTSGATAFTFESPRGVIDEKACHVDFDQMLDIHLLLFEAVLQHALDEFSGRTRASPTYSGDAPPVRATDFPIPTWVSSTQAPNCDKFLGQVVVSNSPDYLSSATARGGCDPRTFA